MKRYIFKQFKKVFFKANKMAKLKLFLFDHKKKSQYENFTAS